MGTKTTNALFKTQDMPVLLRDTSLTKALRSMFARAHDLAQISIRKKGGRYLQISPSVCSRQIIFDRKQKKYLNFYLRDKSDFYTIEQIYLEEGYALEKIRRYNDLISFYENSVRSGKTPLIIDCGGNIGIASRYFRKITPNLTLYALNLLPRVSITPGKIMRHPTLISCNVQLAVRKAVARSSIQDWEALVTELTAPKMAKQRSQQSITYLSTTVPKNTFLF